MKRTIIAAAALLALSTPAWALCLQGSTICNPNAPDAGLITRYSPPRSFGNNSGPMLIDPDDGSYHGNLNNNPFDPNSVSNPFGQYGSRFSPDSINNPYGYGNPFNQ